MQNAHYMCMLADCSGIYFRMEMIANIELGKWSESHSIRNIYESLYLNNVLDLRPCHILLTLIADLTRIDLSFLA